MRVRPNSLIASLICITACANPLSQDPYDASKCACPELARAVASLPRATRR
jgi:hypothetical protein